MYRFDIFTCLHNTRARERKGGKERDARRDVGTKPLSASRCFSAVFFPPFHRGVSSAHSSRGRVIAARISRKRRQKSFITRVDRRRSTSAISPGRFVGADADGPDNADKCSARGRVQRAVQPTSAGDDNASR